MGNGGEGARGEGAGGAKEELLIIEPSPMPHAQIQNSTITGVWSLGWVNFLGAASMTQLVARS